MREISTKKVFGLLLLKLDEMGIPHEKLVEGSHVSTEDLNDSKHRMDWEVFVPLVKRFASLVGSPLELERAGLLCNTPMPARFLGYILSMVSDPKELYWALATMGGRTFFSHIQFKYEDLGENKVRMTLSIPEGYEDCPEFFHVCKGTLSSVTLVHKLPYSIVEMEIKPRSGVYTITVPPSMTVFKRLKRAMSAFRGGRGIIEELKVFQRQIDESYAHLAEAKKRITEHELKIQLLEKLANDSRLSALDRLAGGVGHEINNPLMVITLNADQIAEDQRTRRIDGQRLLKQVQEISNAKDRIARIVSSLVTIGARQTDDRPQPIKVEVVLDSVKNLCAARFAKSGIDFSISPYSPDLQVLSQRALISQAIVHLLNNAYDAASQSREKWISLKVEEREDDVLFKVNDSGFGVPERIGEKIFDPFFSTKEAGRGVGLGLSLARKYIEMQGGKLMLERSCGNSCFAFNLKKCGERKAHRR